MADEMDTCEYIWNHEMAMRRLLSLLRTGQSYCTDGECIELPSGSQTQQGDGDGNQFLMTFVVAAMAFLLFVMRPSANSRRSLGPNADKPSRDGSSGGSGGGGGPPAPAIH